MVKNVLSHPVGRKMVAMSEGEEVRRHTGNEGRGGGNDGSRDRKAKWTDAGREERGTE